MRSSESNFQALLRNRSQNSAPSGSEVKYYGYLFYAIFWGSVLSFGFSFEMFQIIGSTMRARVVFAHNQDIKFLFFNAFLTWTLFVKLSMCFWGDWRCTVFSYFLGKLAKMLYTGSKKVMLIRKNNVYRKNSDASILSITTLLR